MERAAGGDDSGGSHNSRSSLTHSRIHALSRSELVGPAACCVPIESWGASRRKGMIPAAHAAHVRRTLAETSEVSKTSEVCRLLLTHTDQSPSTDKRLLPRDRSEKVSSISLGSAIRMSFPW